MIEETRWHLTRRLAVYTPRFQWHPPWDVTDWWRPAVLHSADEFCNPSFSVVVPPIGWFVFFKPWGRLRTERDGACEDCRREMVL